MITPSIEEIAGMSISLQCSININLPQNVSSPTFEWFFGPNNNSLPTGVMEPVMTSNGNNYTSTIHFSRLLPSHAGQYKCRLRGTERLAANTTVTVNYKDYFCGPYKMCITCTYYVCNYYTDVEIGFEHPSYTVMEGQVLNACLSSNNIGQLITEFSVLISTSNGSAFGKSIFFDNFVSKLWLYYCVGGADFIPLTTSMETFNVMSDKCISIATIPDDILVNKEQLFYISLLPFDEEVFIVPGQESTIIFIESLCINS